MVAECNELRAKQLAQQFAPKRSASSAEASSEFLRHIAEHRVVVLRYSKLLVHASSWDLLSPRDILACLGAASLPVHLAEDAVADSSDEGPSFGMHSSASSSAIVAASGSSSGACSSFGDAAFSERVWSAALPSIAALSFTFSPQESAATIRVAHRLGVAVSPAMLLSCVEACEKQELSSICSGGGDVRTAHAIASQLALLRLQQRRHAASGGTATDLYDAALVASCSSSAVAATLRLLERSAFESWSDLCIALEALHLVGAGAGATPQPPSAQQLLRDAVARMVRLADRLPLQLDPAAACSALQHGFRCVHYVQRLQRGSALSNDLYTALTRVLGRMFARHGSQAPNSNSSNSHSDIIACQLTLCAVEMERAANAICSTSEQASSAAAAAASDVLHRRDAARSTSATGSFNIFAGERHSLDAPLVLDSVADFLVDAAKALRGREATATMATSAPLRSIPADLVAPVCLGAVSAWGAALPHVCRAAFQLLFAAVRRLSATHLVRLLQACAATLRGGASAAAGLGVRAIVLEPLLSEAVATELLAALYVSVADVPIVACCLALRALCELTAPAVAAERRRRARAMRTEAPQYAKRTVVLPSGETRTVILTSPPPRIMANSDDDATDNHPDGGRDDNQEQGQASENLAETVAERFSITARDRCVRTLCSRVYEFVARQEEDDASWRAACTAASATALLSAEERVVDSARAVAARRGFESRVVLEHVAESLALIGMLPASSSSSSSSAPSASSSSLSQSPVSATGSSGSDAAVAVAEDKRSQKRLQIDRAASLC